MTKPFFARIRQSLADPNLQSALDANAAKRISVREKAFATLPDAPALRARAREIRADVIANLDAYLQQFIQNLTRQGIQVHIAADADQAVQIVLELARMSGAKLIAKSKTMVSEEIGLNHALEAAGLRVVETDLGEFIVQIRHEPPSHIITPAVHLRREDVGRTFHEVLGIPYTDDIPTMNAAARRTLRQVFLNADIGISGVNFGVAETGTLCIVTNEGNGRMVTTLPPVHVALMGMERLVPTMADLALVLSLLPRSATGQKLSVYTNLINASRRPGDPDGPSQRHVILVDNGRSRVRQSPLAEILYCIRCGACLNACPVFREIGGHAYVSQSGRYSCYPGPVGSVLAPALFGQADFGHLARASTLCGACKEACPVSIDLPGLLLRVRAGEVSDSKDLGEAPGQEHPQRVPKPNAPRVLALGLKVFTWAAVSPARFSLAQKLAGWFGFVGSVFNRRRAATQQHWLRLPAITGWGLGKDFPAPAIQSFHQRWSRLASQPGISTLPEARVTSPVPATHAVQSPDQNKLDTFAAELAALGASFSLCDLSELPGHILAFLKELGADRILAWSSEYLPAGLLDTLARQGIDILSPSSETKDDCSQVLVGLTGVEAAVADTGSLFLPAGPGRALTASLLPEVHIAILRERDLHAHLSEVLTARSMQLTAAAVLVSGPSRTADIEMTLTIGVHGPGRLYVVCVRVHD